MKDVVALVLAGGIGKRFWPLTTPKPLVSFLGKPLLWYNLELLKTTGIKNVVIVMPPGEHSFSLPEVPGVKFETVVQAKPLGMSDAVFSAERIIGNKSYLLINADDVVEGALYKKLKTFIEHGEMFLVGKRTEQYVDGGYLKLVGNKVTEVIEKPGKGNEPSNFIKLVFDFFPNPANLFRLLRTTKSDRDDVYELALSKLLKDAPAQLVEYDGFWQSLKYPWHILDLMDYFLNQLKPHQGRGVEIRENVIIEGPVYLGDDVRIFENTKIVGPCYIGNNTVIGNNNIIRHSQIGENCVTGFNTDITRSYVGDNSWFHSNYVGDSVLEGNISLGSGTVLANLRLDEGEIGSSVRGERLNTGKNKLGAVIGRNVRVGVNTSIMPGVKIGSGTFIGAGVTLTQDVPEDMFCYGESKIVVKKNNRKIASKSRDLFRKLI